MAYNPLMIPIIAAIPVLGLSMLGLTMTDTLAARQAYTGPINTLFESWFWGHVIVAAASAAYAVVALGGIEGACFALLFGYFSLTRLSPLCLVGLICLVLYDQIS